MTDFPAFAAWVFYGLIGFAAAAVPTCLVFILKELVKLNLRMVQIVAQVGSHEKTIEAHDSRIARLEFP